MALLKLLYTGAADGCRFVLEKHLLMPLNNDKTLACYASLDSINRTNNGLVLAVAL